MARANLFTAGKTADGVEYPPHGVKALKDVQMSRDYRGIEIQKVGVKNVHLPLRIEQKEGGYQTVLGNISLTANLPRHYKGTHMSRFMEILMEWSQRGLSVRQLHGVLEEAKEKLHAKRSEMTVLFKYFVPKLAPVSKNQSLLDYDCEFTASLNGHTYDLILGVVLPVNSLCPCSKEISAYGAHNQRGLIKVSVRFKPKEYLWIEDLIALVEQQGSCQIYPLLKREDEKYVTEHAYDNPKFVEDILRDTILALRGEPKVTWFEVEVENFESIHNHSAYAYHNEELSWSLPE